MTGSARYVVATRELQERLSASVQYQLDPLRRETAPFMRGLCRLAHLVYGPLGMLLPQWVLYDCAAMPGLVFGMAADSSDLPEGAALLGYQEDYSGPVPLSMLVAIPHLEKGHWLVVEVIDIIQAKPELPTKDHRLETLRSAIELLGAKRITVTAQWRSGELQLHTAFAPLDLLAAWLPSHDQPATAVFSYEPAKATSLRTTALIDPGDEAGLRSLQAQLEDGARIQVGAAQDGAPLPITVTETP